MNKLSEIFSKGIRDYCDGYLKVKKINNPSGFEISYGQMYEKPDIELFPTLLALRELFGTEKINVDDYAQGGCETCDYGSDYGHTFQIYDITKNLNILENESLKDE